MPFFNLEKLYEIRENIPKIIRRIVPGYIRKKINKKFFNHYFLPTNLINLPKLNYPEDGNLKYQRNLIEKFKLKNKQSSSMTCPHLIELILMKFNKSQEIKILDIGGEKIDFYLDLKNNFNNLKYFLFNQESMLKPFKTLKSEMRFNDLFIIENDTELKNFNYDFINFGSCIQYFNNYEKILNSIFDKSEYIFFSGTHLYISSEEKYEKHTIVKQVNILPQINYLYFFNQKNFIKIFTNKNYELIFLSENITDKINYKNFNKHFEKIQYSDFLFKKK